MAYYLARGGRVKAGDSVSGSCSVLWLAAARLALPTERWHWAYVVDLALSLMLSGLCN